MPQAEEHSGAVVLPTLTPDVPPTGLARLGHAAATDRRLLSRSSLTVLARVFSKAAQLFVLIAIARLLTVSDFAAYSYLVALAITFGLLADTGVAVVAGRDVSAGRRTTADAFWTGLPLVGLAAAVAAPIAVAFGAAGSGPGHSVDLLLLMAAFVVATMLQDFTLGLLRSVGHFGLEAALHTANAVVFVAGGVAVAAAGFGLRGVMVVLVAKEVLTVAAACVALRDDIRPRQPLRHGAWREMLRMGIRVGIAASALSLATRSSLIILGMARPSAEVAWFSAPLRLADAVVVLAFAAGYGILPGATYLARRDPRRAARLLRRAFVAVTLVGALLGALGVWLAPHIVDVLYGARFDQATPPGRVLLGAMPVYSALGLVWFGLLAFDGDRGLAWVSVLCALVGILVGVAVIPGHGAVGAAWTYVATLAVMTAVALLPLTMRMRRAARTPVAAPG